MLELLRAEGDQRQYFLGTYLRTTIAVAQALKRGSFADAEWVERWDRTMTTARPPATDRVRGAMPLYAAVARTVTLPVYVGGYVL